MFSILHISDLHRSRDEPVDNKSLLAALLADRDRYTVEAPRVPAPEAIVVSGDLVHGARIGDSNWQQSIKEQYAVAHDLLSDLCDRFLDGDRSCMVLVPGNHDVCWNTSLSAMDRVLPTDYPDDLYGELIRPASVYRWSWSEQALFRIVDMDSYRLRMESYWDFVESFYEGIPLPMPIRRERGFQLFELAGRRIVAVGFDSIERNDCFRFTGGIPRDAIGKCAMALRDAGHSYALQVAVWHHSIQGPPIHTDYMDAAQVQEMVGHGFQLGLHGHQHLAATRNQLVHLDQDRSMAVVGAGSLCAGARDLPRGVNRQYNLVVIEDDFVCARVHVRETGDGEQFTRKRTGEFRDGEVEVRWQAATDMMGRKVDVGAENARRAVMVAEVALREGRHSDVVLALGDVDVRSDSYARKLKISALRELGQWPSLTTLLESPKNLEEATLLVVSLIEQRRLVEARERLEAVLDMPDATRAELKRRMDTRAKMDQS